MVEEGLEQFKVGGKPEEKTETDDAPPATETSSDAVAETIEAEAPAPEQPPEPKTDTEHLIGLMKQCLQSEKLLKRGNDYAAPAFAEIHGLVKQIEADREERDAGKE